MHRRCGRSQAGSPDLPLPLFLGASRTDVHSALQLQEVYNLLSLHYVEDKDASLRFNYTAEFLNWFVPFRHVDLFAPPIYAFVRADRHSCALNLQGSQATWLDPRVARRNQGQDDQEARRVHLRYPRQPQGQEEVGSALSLSLSAPLSFVFPILPAAAGEGTEPILPFSTSRSLVKCSEINFLCVHKKLRSKRLAPVLIKEVTRQCNLVGIWQAIYTVGMVLPTPFATSR